MLLKFETKYKDFLDYNVTEQFYKQQVKVSI